jgi:hypothetical protein
MGFREWFLEPITFQLRADQIALEKIIPSPITQKNIERMLIQMGAREDAADARFAELVNAVKEGSAAKDAEIAQLREALTNADADALARVEAALAEDSERDADKKEAGNAALEELVAMPAPSPSDPEPTPEDPAPASSE